MAKSAPNKKLAEALQLAKNSFAGGAVKHSELNSKYIDVLKRAGFLTPVIRGWSLLSKPGKKGSSTVWYVGAGAFLKSYLADRFGKQGYCFSAEASLELHTGQGHISKQITVITKKSSNQTIELPCETSLLLYADNNNYPKHIVKKDGIYVMSLPLALCRVAPSYFRIKTLSVEIALKMSSASDLSRILLEEGLVTSAGRIAGSYRAMGDHKAANQIIDDMLAAGFDVNEVNPFADKTLVLGGEARFVSPYVGRVKALWHKMRGDVVSIFPAPPSLNSEDRQQTLTVIMERYSQDAYHSLSIEGYEVTEDLIEKIANEGWAPDDDLSDSEHYQAMAAKGYYDAFMVVLDSIRKPMLSSDPGAVFEEDLQLWYRKLFSPGVQAGIIKTQDLAGYRDVPVLIDGARHVPPRKEAVADIMEALFELLKEEKHPAVRAVLGHFIFIYIHPYRDGNGRIARFLLNLMLISGGYDWTVVRNLVRSEYMEALEKASIEENIIPFAKLVKSEMEFWSVKKENG